MHVAGTCRRQRYRQLLCREIGRYVHDVVVYSSTRARRRTRRPCESWATAPTQSRAPTQSGCPLPPARPRQRKRVSAGSPQAGMTVPLAALGRRDGRRDAAAVHQRPGVRDHHAVVDAEPGGAHRPRTTQCIRQPAPPRFAIAPAPPAYRSSVACSRPFGRCCTIWPIISCSRRLPERARPPAAPAARRPLRSHRPGPTRAWRASATYSPRRRR